MAGDRPACWRRNLARQQISQIGRNERPTGRLVGSPKAPGQPTPNREPKNAMPIPGGACVATVPVFQRRSFFRQRATRWGPSISAIRPRSDGSCLPQTVAGRQPTPYPVLLCRPHDVDHESLPPARRREFSTPGGGTAKKHSQQPAPQRLAYGPKVSTDCWRAGEGAAEVWAKSQPLPPGIQWRACRRNRTPFFNFNHPPVDWGRAV